MFLNFLTNSISIFIVFLSELSNALMASAAIGKEPVDAITLYLTDHPDSSFANVLDKSEQRRKLKAVSEDMLKTFLEPKAYQFDPVRIFLTQALADLILEPTLVTCSKAEWINGWIVYLLEQGEPELMNAINAGVGEATSKPGSTVVTKQGTQKNSHTIVSESDDEDREALREVKRLNALIAAEQSKQSEEPAEIHEQSKVFKNSDEVASSAPSIDNLLTPTSSQSDLAGSRSYTSLDEQSRTDQDNEEPDEMAVTEAIPITSFDQILSQEQLFSEPTKSIPLTLHKAAVSIFDDSQPSDKSAIRTKPSVDYLLQIEPASSQHPGWMIARKYADFETLHEVLRRISVISGVPEFGNRYPNSPTWRGQTKNTFRINLEKYLREALSHSRLAESEGMKRFLEKDQGLEKLGSSSKGVLGFPSPEAFQTMGKGMLDVLASAPKGAVGGGKVLLDGMKGVGGVFTGQKRSSRPSQDLRTTALQKKSEEGDSSYAELTSQDTEINDDSLLASRVSADSFKPQPLPVLSSSSTDTFEQITTGSISSNRVSFQDTIGLAPDATQQAAKKEDEYERLLNLPPRPDEMDDKEGTVGSAKPPLPVRESRSIGLRESIIEEQTMSNSNEAFSISSPAIQQVQKLNTPLTTEETSIAIELIFATISSLYTLSSVWSIRKALLNAAKTFLIRPGNPNLTKIQTLIQETIIDANVSDTGIAYHLQKLRENSLPTTEEYATWPAPSSTAAKEKLRSKARRLLVEQGLPPALRGIMGAAASGEALGRLFDSLQEEDVARGLIFAVLVQGIRALAH